jgi:hypothetical protein
MDFVMQFILQEACQVRREAKKGGIAPSKGSEWPPETLPVVENQAGSRARAIGSDHGYRKR